MLANQNSAGPLEENVASIKQRFIEIISSMSEDERKYNHRLIDEFKNLFHQLGLCRILAKRLDESKSSSLCSKILDKRGLNE